MPAPVPWEPAGVRGRIGAGRSSSTPPQTLLCQKSPDIQPTLEIASSKPSKPEEGCPLFCTRCGLTGTCRLIPGITCEMIDAIARSRQVDCAEARSEPWLNLLHEGRTGVGFMPGRRQPAWRPGKAALNLRPGKPGPRTPRPSDWHGLIRKPALKKPGQQLLARPALRLEPPTAGRNQTSRGIGSQPLAKVMRRSEGQTRFSA